MSRLHSMVAMVTIIDINMVNDLGESFLKNKKNKLNVNIEKERSIELNFLLSRYWDTPSFIHYFTSNIILESNLWMMSNIIFRIKSLDDDVKHYFRIESSLDNVKHYFKIESLDDVKHHFRIESL